MAIDLLEAKVQNALLALGLAAYATSASERLDYLRKWLASTIEIAGDHLPPEVKVSAKQVVAVLSEPQFPKLPRGRGRPRGDVRRNMKKLLGAAFVTVLIRAGWRLKVANPIVAKSLGLEPDTLEKFREHCMEKKPSNAILAGEYSTLVAKLETFAATKRRGQPSDRKPKMIRRPQ